MKINRRNNKEDKHCTLVIREIKRNVHAHIDVMEHLQGALEVGIISVVAEIAKVAVVVGSSGCRPVAS